MNNCGRQSITTQPCKSQVRKQQLSFLGQNVSYFLGYAFTSQNDPGASSQHPGPLCIVSTMFKFHVPGNDAIVVQRAPHNILLALGGRY